MNKCFEDVKSKMDSIKTLQDAPNIKSFLTLREGIITELYNFRKSVKLVGLLGDIDKTINEISRLMYDGSAGEATVVYRALELSLNRVRAYVDPNPGLLHTATKLERTIHLIDMHVRESDLHHAVPAALNIGDEIKDDLQKKREVLNAAPVREKLNPLKRREGKRKL